MVLTALVVPLGRYMARVFEGERTFLSPVLRPVETVIYRLAGVDEKKEQGWLTYTAAMLLFNAAGFLAVYGLMRLQAMLPLNPAEQSAVPADLTFNTAVSFATNTNWQNYGGESTLSYLTQMVGSDDAELPVGGHRHRLGCRAHPRLRARVGDDRRQFLGRFDALDALRAAAAVDHRCAHPGLAGLPAEPRRLCRRDARSKAPSRRSAKARLRRRSPSSSSAPMAAASGTPIPRIPYENPTAAVATSSKCSTSC